MYVDGVANWSADGVEPGDPTHQERQRMQGDVLVGNVIEFAAANVATHKTLVDSVERSLEFRLPPFRPFQHRPYAVVSHSCDWRRDFVLLCPLRPYAPKYLGSMDPAQFEDFKVNADSRLMPRLFFYTAVDRVPDSLCDFTTIVSVKRSDLRTLDKVAELTPEQRQRFKSKIAFFLARED